MEDTNLEIEIDDEVQDWSQFSTKTSNGLPKRGEKDFEPDGTNVQKSLLEKSQESMFNALSCERGHIIKQNIKSYWNNDLRKGLMHKPKGSFLQTIGLVDSKGNCWLNRNEFVYLSERGTIEPFYNDKDVPLDMNSVYAMCFTDEDQIDQYHVYSHLKRHGYIVLDYTPFEKKSSHTTNSISYSLIKPIQIFYQSIIKKLSQFDFVKYVLKISAFHPLHFIYSKYLNYSQIFNSIKIQPIPLSSPILDSNIKLTFNVWKPNPQFSKKNPNSPNFQILVLNVNKFKLPTLLQLKNLFDENSVESMPQSKSQMNRLKQGEGNIILAIVDYGVINFVKLSKGIFNNEDMLL